MSTWLSFTVFVHIMSFTFFCTPLSLNSVCATWLFVVLVQMSVTTVSVPETVIYSSYSTSIFTLIYKGSVGQVWSCVGHVWSCMGHVWFCVGHVWSYLALCLCHVCTVGHVGVLWGSCVCQMWSCVCQVWVKCVLCVCRVWSCVSHVQSCVGQVWSCIGHV